MASPHSSSPVSILLEKARRGDEQARDLLFEKCRNYVALVARAQMESWMQAKVDASDLVQQTLLEAHRAFGDFRGGTEAEWLGWLRGILKHNAADFIRRFRQTRKRQEQRESPLWTANPEFSDALFYDPSDPGASPSQILLQREREMEVADAITQLPEDYQEVILLRNLQRLPFDQVAARMGRSRPAVQMLWMRALKKLQEILPE